MQNLSCFLSFVLFTAPIFSLPLNPVVHMGNVKIRCEENFIEIDSGDYAHLNWDDFSIDENETVRFLQPHETSLAINQVLEPNPSVILGRLESLGQVVLINPNGILVGESAIIDTGSLIASTLDLIESSSKKLRFSSSNDGALENLGTIYTRSGPVVFLSEVIENKGSITTQFNALFGSGQGASITLDDFTLSLEKCPLGRIAHSGAITANSCYFKSINGGIQNYGTITASEEIFFEAPHSIIEQRGTLTCKTPEDLGGEVRILGKANHLYETSVIDVSGKWGGGTVLIGGDYKGENPEIPNSKHTWCAPQSLITADALEIGDGGKVILWGDQLNFFRGSVFARGGLYLGDGGFIEISSKGTLDPMGEISAKAYTGEAGLVLFDPCAVTISTAGDAGLLAAPPPYGFTGLTANINIAALAGILGGGTSVVIDASASGTAGIGSITLNADADVPAGATLTWPTPNSLTLIADGSIFIRNLIDATNGATASATPLIDISAPVVEIGDPGFTIANQTALTTTSGAVRINSPTSLSIYDNTTATGGIVAGNLGTSGTADITTGTLLIQADTMGSSIIGDVDVIINATGDISLLSATAFTSIESNTGTISITGGGNVDLLAGTGVSSYAQIVSFGGDLTCQIAGDYTLTGSDFPVLGNALIGINGGAVGTVDLSGANYTLNSGLGLSSTQALIGHIGPSTGDVVVTATGPTGIVINARRTNAQIRSIGPGSIIVNSTNIVLNGTTTPGASFVSSDIRSFSGGVDVNATGDITINGSTTGIFNVSGVYASGAGFDVNITANNVQMFGGTSPASFSRFQAQRGAVFVNLNGDLFMQGGSDNISGISSAEFSAGDITINARNLTLVGGTGPAGGMGISAGNITAPPGGNGSVFITLRGDLDIIGGTGAGAQVGMSTVGSLSTNSIRILGIGPTSNFNLNAVGGPGSDASIFSFNGGGIDIVFANDVTLTSTPGNTAQIYAGAASFDPVTIIAGGNMAINGASTITNLGTGDITLVVDQNFPQPFLGPGSFSLDAAASLTTTTGAIRVFTSQQSLNSIQGLLNGLSFTPGTLFTDTNQEIWCTYYPSNLGGNPFTVFYKDCIQPLAQQAETVVVESLVDFHPYDASPGWWLTFSMSNQALDLDMNYTSHFFIEKPLINAFWMPKSYTAYLHSTMDYENLETSVLDKK